MDLTRFKKVLSTYATDELKALLGNNLADMLIEWTPNDQSLFKKTTLADMIATIHGVTILKDKSFRQLFLTRLGKNDILSFRDVMPKKYQASTDLKEIVEFVAARSWRKDNVNDHLLSLLELQKIFFNKRIQKRTQLRAFQLRNVSLSC